MSIQGLSASFAQPAVAATASLSPAASGLSAAAPLNTGTGVAIHSPDGDLAEIRQTAVPTHALPQVFSPDDADQTACTNCTSHGAPARGVQGAHSGDGQTPQPGGADQGGAGAAQLGNLLSGLLKMAMEGVSKAIPAMAAGGAAAGGA